MIKPINVYDFAENKVDLMTLYPEKSLLLIFYNNSCLGCTGRAIPLAYEYQQEYDFIQVIGIHSNFSNENISEKDIRSIFTIDELPFPIYIDKEHKVYDSFECEGTPQWILMSTKGEVFRSIFGSQTGAQNRLYYALEMLKEEK